MSDDRRTRGSTPPFGQPALGREAEAQSVLVRELKARLEIAERNRDIAEAKVREVSDRTQALFAENAMLKQRLHNDPVVGLQLAGFQRASTAMMIGYVNGKILIGNAAAEQMLGDVSQVSIYPLLLDHMESPIALPSETTGVRPFPRPYGHDLWKRFWTDESLNGDARVIHERVKIRSPLQQEAPFDVSLILKELRDDSDHPWIQIEIIPHDPLNRDERTGLYRHEVAVNKIVRGIGSGEDLAVVPRPVAVIALDLDDLKVFNTEYGYEGGNAAICKLANALVRTVRPNDLVARWLVGDELVIVLDGDEDVAQDVSERVHGAIGELTVLVTEVATGHKRRVPVSASIGWAVHEPGDNWKTLTDRAFQNVVVSKKKGKNCITGGMPQLSRTAYSQGKAP